MKKLTRRDFLKTSAGSAGLLAAAPSLLEALDASRTVSFAGSDVVPLGKTGIKVSRLAQGTGFSGGNQSSAHTRMGQKAFSQLLHHSLDEGVTFMDMADLYGSHPYVVKTVKDVPRDNLVYLSKLWPRKESWITPSGGAKREVDPLPQGARHRPPRRVPHPLHAERAVADRVRAHPGRAVAAQGERRGPRGRRLLPRLRGLEGRRRAPVGRRHLRPDQPQGRARVLLRRLGPRGGGGAQDRPGQRQGRGRDEDLRRRASW